MCQSSRFSKLMSHKWGFVFEKKMINPLLEDIFFQAHSLILAVLLTEYLLFFPDSSHLGKMQWFCNDRNGAHFTRNKLNLKVLLQEN